MHCRLCCVAAGSALVALSAAEPVRATPAGKLGFEVVRMEALGAYPSYADDTFGGAMSLSFATPFAPEHVAFDFGTEFLNFNRADIDFQDPISGLPFQQSTSQSYLRFFGGFEAGLFRNPGVQPFVSAHIGAVEHNVSPVISVPGDFELQEQLMFEVDDSAKWSFAYDVAAGARFDLFEHVGLGGGAKFIQSSEIDVRHGQEIRREKPSYFQIFVGIVYDFGLTHAIE
jgi:opacity protein-like surface antigen